MLIAILPHPMLTPLRGESMPPAVPDFLRGIAYPITMPNYRRANIPGGTFFFTVVTCHRRPIFADFPTRKLFGNSIRDWLVSSYSSMGRSRGFPPDWGGQSVAALSKKRNNPPANRNPKVKHRVTDLPRWKIQSPKNGRWSVELTLSVDTSAAQAKRLKEHTVSR